MLIGSGTAICTSDSAPSDWQNSIHQRRPGLSNPQIGRSGPNHAREFIGRDRIEAVLLANGTQLPARHFVSAVPPRDLAPLLPKSWKDRLSSTALGCFEPCPYISCYLWFDRKIMRERFISHLWSPTRLNYDFYDLSKIRRGWDSRPSILASNIIYSHRAQAMSDEEIIRATMREIVEFAPAATQAHILHSRVHRIPMAIPCPVPGTEVKRPPTRTSIPGLVLAGDWIQTQLPYCMESATRSGWLRSKCWPSVAHRAAWRFLHGPMMVWRA